MKVNILSCGPGLPEVVSKYGHSSEWIPNAINDPNISYNIIKVYNNETFSLDDHDAFIVTGSKYSVYEPVEWISDLKEYVNSIIISNKPLLGICFGHQVIASCLGGIVEKNPKGWELGSYNLTLTELGKISPLFNGISNLDVVYESHQDVVSTLPDSVVELAYTKKSTQSFSFRNNIYGVQFHPEFSYEVTRQLMNLRLKKGIKIDSNNLVRSVNGNKLLNNFINIVKGG